MQTSTQPATFEKVSDTIQVPGFHVETPGVASEPTISTDGYFGMRDWQRRCCDELEESHHWIVNAPMASGKSFEICAMAAKWLSEDPLLKVVIAVPQRIIAEGFRKNKIELPSGKRFEWEIASHNDLCKESPRSSTAHLLEFLGLHPGTARDRVVLCTHATLVRIPPRAFKNVLIVIDEAHHVKHEGADVGNKLGALVKHALTNPDGVKLGLTTATWMRGDKINIVPDLSVFTRFDLAYDEFLATCKYLRSFSYDFIISANYSSGLNDLFGKTIGKTIVYIPYVNSRYSVGSKAEDVKAVLRAIAGCVDPEIESEDGPVMRVKRGDQWIRVVNLVDEQLREEKQDAIWQAHESEKACDLDVIISLKMFQEGANWRYANREIIIGQRNSLTEVIQTQGRLFRDVEGKTHVETYHLLPFAFDQTDKAAVREDLNDYMKAILLSMLLEDVYSPMMPSPRDTVDSKGGWIKTNYLKEAIPDGGELAAVMEEIRECVVDALALNDSYHDIENFREPYQNIVSTILSGHNIQRYHTEIADQMLRMFNRRTVALKGLSVGHVDIELIKENPFGCLLHWGSAVLGTVTFKELRAATRAFSFLPFNEALVVARSSGINNAAEWMNWIDKPNNVPSNPAQTYKHEGWVSWGHWLGTGSISKSTGKTFLPFQEALVVARASGIKTRKEWWNWTDRPVHLPRNPAAFYINHGWISWAHWLGTEWLAFKEALAVARQSGIRTKEEWMEWPDRPKNVPSNPAQTYKGEGWISWPHWLGTEQLRTAQTGPIPKSPTPFDEALVMARSSGVNSAVKWMSWTDRPSNLPRYPNHTYKNKGWISWSHWLGTDRTTPKKKEKVA